MVSVLRGLTPLACAVFIAAPEAAGQDLHPADLCPTAAPCIYTIGAELRHERLDQAARLPTDAPLVLESDILRISADGAAGRAAFGGYLDLRNTDGSTVVFGPAPIKARGATVALYAAYEVFPAVYAGVEGSLSHDDGTLGTPFGAADLALDGLGVTPFLYTALPLGPGTLELSLSWQYARQRLGIGGARDAHLTYSEADLSVDITMPLTDRLSGHGSADLIIQTEYDALLGEAKPRSVTARIGGGLSFALTDSARLKLEGETRLLDSALDETFLSARLDFDL